VSFSALAFVYHSFVPVTAYYEAVRYPRVQAGRRAEQTGVESESMSQNDSIENKSSHGGNDAHSGKLDSTTVQSLYSEPSTFKTATQASGTDVSHYLGGLTITDAATESTASAAAGPMNLTDVKVQMEKLYPTLDPDHTGSVSIARLAGGVEDPHITGDEAKALAVIYASKAAERGASSVTPSTGFGNSEASGNASQNSTLTQAVVNTLPTSVSAEKNSSLWMNYLNDRDSHGLESNTDGRLSPDDLNKYAPIARSDYQTVIKNYLIQNPNLADASQIRKEGLNSSELAQATEMQNDRLQEASELTSRLGWVNGRQSEPTTAPLYGDAQDPLKSINMDAIRQGEVGNCYFEASLADVARLQPSIIRDSIKTNKDGTYTVTFKGDPGHPITVAPPTETEQNTFNGTTKNGLWADVMEKAFGAYEVQYGGRQAIGETDTEASAGGVPGDAIKLLTGNNEIRDQRLELTADSQSGRSYFEQKDAMAANLAAAASNGDYAVVGTSNLPDLYQYTGLEQNHAYTVAGYTPGPHGGIFHLRNPAGDGRYDFDRFAIYGDNLTPHISQISTAEVNGK
jgi:hypothetical protein